MILRPLFPYLIEMPQSLSSLLVHLVFSTKNREPWLLDSFRDELHAYLGGTISNHDGVLLKAGSVADHIHLLASHPRTMAPADFVKEIKVASSKWLKQRDRRCAGFHWQAGYGIFSISPSRREAVERYLARQAQHHRKVAFQDEYRRLLTKYGVAWDERCVWE